jgi:hypothetical protein
MREHMVKQESALHDKYLIQFVHFCNTYTHTTKDTCYCKHTTEGEGRKFQQTREEENFCARFEKNIQCLICQWTDGQL